jgi:hypothetical protein
MKKIIILILLLILLGAGSAYFFIPSKIKIGAVAESSMNIKVAYRYLENRASWAKWWPGPKALHSNGIDFTIDKIKLNSFEIRLLYKKDTVTSLLEMIPLNNDSTAYRWSCEMEAGNNPFNRWIQYFHARHIKKSLSFLIDNLTRHVEKEENIYGFKAQKTKVVDSVLISTQSSFDHYPNPEEIEQMIQKLRDYIKKEKAAEKNFPMLNVHQAGTNNYEAIVAISTDLKLPATKDFAPKLVLKGGNVLEAEFKGGPFAIIAGFQEFENYKEDHKLTAPAIPYQLMVTDRTKEKDTSKWVTKFYYPIF